MKKSTLVIAGFIALSVIALLCFFWIPQHSISADEPATLTYVYGDKNISETLTEDETVLLAEIFNERKEYRGSTPSCGFDKNISVTVGGVTFAPARDLCNSFMNVRRLSYFDISEEEMAAVREIFEKYGGTFPCI